MTKAMQTRESVRVVTGARGAWLLSRQVAERAGLSNGWQACAALRRAQRDGAPIATVQAKDGRRFWRLK